MGLANTLHLARCFRQSGNRPGSPRGVKVIELHMGNTQCHGDMTQAAIHADDPWCMRHRVRRGVQPHGRPYPMHPVDAKRWPRWWLSRQCCRVPALLTNPQWFARRPNATQQSMGHCSWRADVPWTKATQGFRGVNVLSACSAAGSGYTLRSRQQAKRLRVGQRIAHRRRTHQTCALHGMHMRLQRDSNIRYPPRGSFITRTLGLVVHGKAAALGRGARQPGHQCRLGQSLRSMTAS